MSITCGFLLPVIFEGKLQSLKFFINTSSSCSLQGGFVVNRKSVLNLAWKKTGFFHHREDSRKSRNKLHFYCNLKRTGTVYLDTFFPEHSRLARIPLNPPPGPEEAYSQFASHVYNENEYRGYISVLLAEVLSLPRGYILDLMRFGAVWMAEIVPEEYSPQKRQSRTPLRWLKFQYENPRYVFEDFDFVPEQTYIKVSINPQRYPKVSEIDWRASIVWVHDDFLIVNKPTQIPVGATDTNAIECTVHQIKEKFELNIYPIPVNEMDICASGLLILARSWISLEELTESLSALSAKYIYRVLCTDRVPLGVYRHHARKQIYRAIRRKNRGCQVCPGPRMPYEQKRRDERVALPRIFLEYNPGITLIDPETCMIAEMFVTSCEPKFNGQLYELTIEVLSNNEQNIRAQLASMSCYIFGDTKYMPVVGEFAKYTALDGNAAIEFGPEPDRAAFHLENISFEYQNSLYNFSASSPWWQSEKGTRIVYEELRRNTEKNDREKSEPSRVEFSEQELDYIMEDEEFRAPQSLEDLEYDFFFEEGVEEVQTDADFDDLRDLRETSEKRKKPQFYSNQAILEDSLRMYREAEHSDHMKLDYRPDSSYPYKRNENDSITYLSDDDFRRK